MCCQPFHEQLAFAVQSAQYVKAAVQYNLKTFETPQLADFIRSTVVRFTVTKPPLQAKEIGRTTDFFELQSTFLV